MAHQIKTALERLGLSFMWNNLHNDQNISIFQFIKQRMLDHYHQTWYSKINNSKRLKTYCRSKHSFSIEPYLDYYGTDRRFQYFSKHISSILKQSWDRNFPRTERICKICWCGFVETENHFLLTCVKYLDLQCKYLKP